MLKLHRWVKAVVVVVISLVSIAVCGAEERFDFELHKTHFLKGEYKTSIRPHRDTQTVEIVFADGCTVRYEADLYSGRTSKWRWARRELHGTLMNYALKYEKT